MSVPISVHVLNLTGPNIYYENSIVRISEGQLTPVRRPARLEVKRRFFDRNGTLIATLLVRNYQLVLAWCIVEPRDLTTVRRPGRRSVRDAG